MIDGAYQAEYSAEVERACIVCHETHGLDDDAKLVICDGCERYFHIERCTALNGVVPTGNWYCASCVPGGVDENKRDAKAIKHMFKPVFNRKTTKFEIAECIHRRTRKNTMAATLAAWIPEFEMYDDLRFREFFREIMINNTPVTLWSPAVLNQAQFDDRARNSGDIFDTLQKLHERHARIYDIGARTAERHNSELEIDNSMDGEDASAIVKDKDGDEDAGFISATAPLLKSDTSDDGDGDEDENDDSKDGDYVPDKDNDGEVEADEDD